MAEHDLKVWPEYFEAIAAGKKTFEIRKDDRGYQVGDTLNLREYAPAPVLLWLQTARDTLRSGQRHSVDGASLRTHHQAVGSLGRV